MIKIIFLLVLLLLAISLYTIQYKNKKNIGQKISFLYNHIYIILISLLYKKENIKKDILKEELSDYYKNIVLNKRIDKQYELGQEIKEFILQYASEYKKEYRKKVIGIYDLLDLYYNKYYISVSKFLNIMLFTIIFIVFIIAYIMLFKYIK